MKLDIVQKLTPTSQACGCWVLSSNSFAPQSSSFWAVLLANVDIKLAELPGIPQGAGRGSDLKGFKKSLYLSVYGIHFGVRYLLNLEKMHHPIYLSVISQQWCTDKLFSQNWWASIISGTKGKIKMLWLHKLIGGLFFSFFFHLSLRIFSSAQKYGDEINSCHVAGDKVSRREISSSFWQIHCKEELFA